MKNILFIHGMFQNPKSWEKWISYFESKGYQCSAPAWPYHEGEPSQLRANPSPQLGDLHLREIVDEISFVAKGLDNPILIGHSVGGLIVQLLISKGIGFAGVAIDSVAPNAMLAFDWGFMKNSALIANPFKGNDPFEMDADTFYASFGNAMSREESDAAFEAFATHDSRNVLRDCMGEDGQIDLDLPHAPLLFIGGEKDQIIPPELNQKNAEAYTDTNSHTFFQEFPNRGHYICGQPGWEEVADSIYNWLEDQSNNNLNKI
ncbi:alpha/beta hydrolase [Mucilaginibacter ginkgonis]|uniref:Alpha/beta hydrolase n=1 Tax=Mucilaginibacter ginkgonis TaxID=2682091 RepID=A0A6I4HZA6_9SPHI|nr:alpha/beta hydrolase [Mucilaginibacter ginkgonis]QQL49433.1 alpha/beta hydrolase [Mucilaginibacter ginkgonis]